MFQFHLSPKNGASNTPSMSIMFWKITALPFAISAGMETSDLKKMLKDKAISEDDEKNGLAEIQKLTDDYIHKLEDVAKKKEQEILTV